MVSHLWPTLGLERAVLNLADALSESGVEVRIICIGGTDKDRAAWSNVLVAGPPHRGWKRANLFSAQRVRRFTGDAGAVIVAGVWAALPYLALGTPTARSTWIWEHSLVTSKVSSSRSLPTLGRLASLLYPRAAGIVCVSQPLADDMARVVPAARLEVIPNALDEGSHAAVSAEALGETGGTNSLRVLSIGSLSPTKNQSLLLEMLTVPGLDGAELTLAGSGPDLAELRARATTLGVVDRVRFLGYIDAARVAIELRRCDVVAHAALGETFGYAYFEAAAACRPVVAVSNSVSRDLIPEFVPGLLVDNSPTEFADAIQQILRKSWSVDEFRVAKARRISTYSGPTVAHSWRELLQL